MNKDNSETSRPTYRIETKESCNVLLASEELVIVSKVLVQDIEKKENLESELKRYKSYINAKIQVVEKEIGELMALISNGYEKREIACTIVLDRPVIGKKVCIRDDTGEQVWERDMTQDDSQLKLSLEGVEASKSDEVEIAEASEPVEGEAGGCDEVDISISDLVSEGEAIIESEKREKKKGGEK